MLNNHTSKNLYHGKPADDIVFVGVKKIDKIKIELISFDKSDIKIVNINDFEKSTINHSKTQWINIIGLHDAEQIRKLGNNLDIHPIVLADIVNTDHHPKIDFFERYIFIIIKIMKINEINGNINSEHLCLLLGDNYIISFVESESNLFDYIKNRLNDSESKLRNSGADFICYSIIDLIIDDYFKILESSDELIENMEDKLLYEPDKKILEEVQHVKRNLIYLRNAVWPLREIVRKIEIEGNKLFNTTTDIYIKDLYDHTYQIVETIETQREILAEMFDIYLSATGNKLNEIMKVLTIISTIFIPLTFISSIYGMNFKFMPELEWHFSYPIVMFIMFGLSIFMLYKFRKKKWL